MTRSNYIAWKINNRPSVNLESPEQLLTQLARYAILAPSGHNTQPWKIHIAGQTLTLYAHSGRYLPYSGLKANEPLVSLGSFLGVLKVAASGMGYKLSITHSESNDKIATVKIAGKEKPSKDLLDAITQRVSNRNLYENKPVTSSVLSKITASKPDNTYIKVISEQDDIDFIADQTVDATKTIMSDKDFRLELSKWVRNNATRQYDGMPGFVQGIPTPPSLLAKHIIKRVNVSNDQSKKDYKRVKSTHNLIILGVKNNTGKALLDAGGFYSTICVNAQKYGVATAGIGTAIIDPTTTKNVVKKYALPGKPIAIIRLGYTTKISKHTPRWPLEKVLI